MNWTIKKQQLSFAPIIAVLTLLMTLPTLAATPVEVDKLLASDGSNFAGFGYSVSISGDTAVIGAPYERDPVSNLFFGSVYVFVRNTDGLVCNPVEAWCEQSKLMAADASDRDRFGFWVDIDGDTVVVGARQDDDGGPNTGSAYVFVRSGTSWSQQAKLNASDAGPFDRFGTSVSLSGDTAVIGAGEADGLEAESGKAYVFTRTGTTWSEEARLTAGDQSAGALFGHYVSLSGDTVLLAAHKDDTLGVDSGAAYIFERNTAAVACPETSTVDPWCQQAKLTASDGGAGHWFGGRVSLSYDTALVGAPFADGVSPDSGAAYVYTRSGTVWTEQTKLMSSDGNTGDNFGFGAAISGDTALVASDGDSDIADRAGSAYVFLRSGGIWTEQTPKLVASDGQSLEFLGWNVELSGDLAILGVPRPFINTVDPLNPNFGDPGPGSAYIFDIQRSATPTGDDVLVEPFPVDGNGDPVEDAPEISLAFATVLETGETSVTITEEGPSPPTGFELVGVANSTYLEIDTTATFDGLVEICIDYSEFVLAGDPANLSFGHFVDGELIDITSSIDLINMILCGMTPSFSFFAIVEVIDPLLLLEGLVATVDVLNAKKDTRQSLLKKLDNVEKYLGDSKKYNESKALKELVDKFVPKVEKYRGKHIADSEADDLVDKALDLATVILY